MQNGWVKVPREILNNEVIFKDSEHLAIYIYLLLNASHDSTGKILFKNQEYEMSSGEVCIRIREVSKTCDIEQTKVLRILRLFEKCNIIATRTDGRKTLVSIGLSGNIENDIATKVQQKCNKLEEKQDEKEKSSKREKEEIKEEYKNKEPPISPPRDYFYEFWRAYPKKVGKSYAKKCFLRLKVGEELLEKMLKTLEWQAKSDRWREKGGVYIPNPSTWLNQGRWDDEETNCNKENYYYGEML